MSVLLLRLAGPMQSWGVQSRFSVRETGLEPSKSGVLGLLCAALGRPRHEPLDDLAGLRMGVRVDREGRLALDYHTAGGEWRVGSVLGRDRQGRPVQYGVAKADGSGAGAVVSSRYYLADAEFLVALQGDAELVRRLDDALQRPVWPLYLGRKAFVPGCPVRLGVQSDHPDSLLGLLKGRPWLPRRPRENPPERLRLVLETDFGAGEPRNDVPLSFAQRRFTIRHVAVSFCDAPPPAPYEEDLPCT
jgi:CRISPR system Cascade subunit CasD